MATLTIQQLKVSTVIGVYDWEKAAKQSLLIDLEFQIDLKKVQSDQINDTFDYATIADGITEWASVQQFQLIEFFAKALQLFLQQTFHLQAFSLSIHKPGAVKNAKDICLSLTSNG